MIVDRLEFSWSALMGALAIEETFVRTATMGTIQCPQLQQTLFAKDWDTILLKKLVI